MEVALIFKCVMAGLAVVAAIIGVWILIEILRIFSQIRKITDRVEFVSDLRSWGSILRKLPRRKSKND